ncbi:MAG: S8 family serine peptidase [Arenimonas sp.]
MPAAFAAAPVDPPALYREGEVLVRYRAGVSAAEMQALHGKLGLLAKRSISRGRIELLQLPQVTTTAAALALLKGDPAVEVAEPNVLRFARIACPDNAGLFCPNDPTFAQQWALRSTGQLNFATNDPALASIPGADMDLLLAWDPGADDTFERIGNNTVTIAFVDDSFNIGHPDLSANYVPGFDFENNDTNVGPDTLADGHGTLVAGSAGAIGNNGAGVAGTAWNVKLMPLKFGFDSDDHIAALAFARDNGAQIVNASFGGPLFSQMEEDAINDLAANDILYVAAAGNDDSNSDIARLNYPANYAAPNIVSVAATNRQDRIASFSQYGALSTEVAAPGLQIVTTTSPGSYSTPSNCQSGGSCGVSGTSFSAPYTAGVAALILSEYPTASVAEIKARLIEGAEDGDEVNLRTAGGRVNAAQSLDLAARPALIITGIDWLDANDALDPGESTSVAITIENLWQQGTGVSGTLGADNGVTVTSGALNFGTVAEGGTATATFNVDVGAGIVGHRYVHFTLALSANGGAYTATRGFIGEIGRLATDVLTTQTFASRDVDLYDEFHAWHYDFDGTLPAGHTQLVIETTSTAPGLSSPDIDLLVKRTVPPEYSITVGINPEQPGVFCTSGTTFNCRDPDVFIDADGDGAERVAITDPPAGTYHIVIVNFAQLQNGMTYTLRAYTRAAPASFGGGGGGGRVPVPVLAALIAATLARRLLRAA